MKNVILVIAGMVMLGSTSSCKRNFTCTCVYPDSKIGTTKTSMKSVRKSDAEDACAMQNAGAKMQGGACAL
jgi:hypothetical protein